MAKFSFSFLVLCFNHEKYIIQHLESIKYLVINYGESFNTELLISDDCSNDNTVLLIDFWLKENEFLFKNVKRFFNKKNVGTANVVKKLIQNITTTNFKITAGDDMYSFENIFKYSSLPENVSFLSGRTVVCNDVELFKSYKVNFLEKVSSFIYENKLLPERFKHFSYTNAPNLFYSNDILNYEVLEYLSTFDVTEDLPLQYILAKRSPNNYFKIVDVVFVYYRRTSGSTFLVANERFKNDKIKIYNDMIEGSINKFERLRLKSRLYCFLLNNPILNKILNLDFYFFVLNFLLIAHKVDYKHSDINFGEHCIHFNMINDNTSKFLENISKYLNEENDKS